jgi:1,4-alpha-glucan branching enzyme
MGGSWLRAQAAPLGTVIQRSGTTVTGVTFRVWAPNATGVAVRGEFNDWGETALTKEAGSSGYWSATVAAARPGQTYKYFLRWSGNTAGVWKNDPRAMWVRGGNSVIHDHAAFDWSGHVRPTVPPNRQVMYELHIGTFNDPDPTDNRPGTFDDAIAKLDYLQRLGVNVIALMPINEFGGDFSWGYNPEHLFAIETAYGGPDGFKRFVKAAHARGMQVQVDVVHNHWNPPPDGVAQFDGPSDIYVFSDPVKAWTPWGERPDYDKPEVRRFIEDQIRMYLDDYRVDGFRWDSPQNILGYDSTKTSANPDTILASGKSLLTGINRMIHDGYPNCWSIAEDANLLAFGVQYPDNAFLDGLVVSDIRDSFDGHWQTSFHNEITPEVASSSPNVGRILAKVNGWSEPPGFRVIFTDNHDKAGDLNNAVRLADRMVPQDPMGVTARRKSLLSAALTLTAPGTPMLFMGQELHEIGEWSDRAALGWLATANDGRRHRMLRAHRDLVELRKSLPALWNSDLQEVDGGINEELDLMLYWRRIDGSSSPADDLVVLMNFSGQIRQNVNVSFPSTGTWHVRFNSDWPGYGADFTGIGPAGNTVAVGGNRQSAVTIGPHSAIVLAKSAGAPAVADDADADGMPDGWELLTGAVDPAGDEDNDGFSNELEFLNGTDPTIANPVLVSGSFNAWSTAAGVMRPAGATDVLEHVLFAPTGGPGEFKFIIDGQWHGTSATTGTTSPDGGNIATSFPAGSYVRISLNVRTLAYAVESFTPATRVDADGDGMDDRWERFHNASNPAANPDNDAFTHLQEFQRGSDPNVANRSTITLVGDFNGWNLSANPMTFAGDSLWRIDLP